LQLFINRKKELTMKKRNVIDKRRITLEKVQRRDYIPFLGGRPGRTKVINKDDVVNLSIELNINKSIDGLLKKL